MESKPAKKTGKSVGKTIKSFFGAIGRFLVTLIMVGIITGCIVACVLTVYIFNLIGADNSIDLSELELGYSSTMVYYDKTSESWEELEKLYFPDNNRIWVAYEDISDWVKIAVVCTEDKRFEDHLGVDWIRTFGAFVGQFIPGAVEGGGSTITQQLIKNITNDDAYRVDRKVREIFRALDLEKKYTKEQILEAYLNVVPFGAGTNGIESAALTYFGKHASELEMHEAAAIVGITKYPGAYSPYLNEDKNKDRQRDVLWFMCEQGKITEEEYDVAVELPLNFKKQEYDAQTQTIWNYYADHVYRTVLADLQEKKDWTYSYAHDQLYKGGYTIYTCVDMDMQNYLEEFYLTTEKFPPVSNQEYPQSAANIIEPNGKLLATVGYIGEKTGNLMLNRATMSTRQPGSSIKPLGVYALAFEYNTVNWSSIIDDHALSSTISGQSGDWPVNHYRGYYGNIPVVYAVQQSTNTVAAKLCHTLTPQAVFNFMHDQLNMYNLVESAVIDGGTYSDIGLAPLALGALTKGVTPLEMVGGYQIYANGGTFTTPYCYTTVEDSDGKVILQADTTPRQVISEETAVVFNKVLQSVNTAGTGRPAQLEGMVTAGKTGTSDKDVNQWYIGMSPYYVCQVWLGYDEEIKKNENGQWVDSTIYYTGLSYPPPVLWKNIMAPLHEGLESIGFLENENVVQRQYCTITGKLASAGCPSAYGWYKSNSANGMPGTCTGHPTVSPEGDGENGDGSSGTDPLRIQSVDNEAARFNQGQDNGNQQNSDFPPANDFPQNNG